MAYTRVNWQDLPSTATPRNATNLNNMDAGIKTNDDKLLGIAPMGNIVVDSIKTKNVFGNYIIRTGYISGTQMRIYSPANDRMAFIPCEASTTYTISRSVVTSSFRVSDYTTMPSQTTTSAYFTIPTVVENNTGTEMTYTTSSSAKYLIIHYGNVSNDSATTLENSLASIQVEKGSTKTTFYPFQDLNTNASGLDNNDSTYGGLAKRSVRENTTTYTIIDPNYQDSSYIRNAMVMCGDSGILFFRWSGNNSTSPSIFWSSLTGGKTCSISHSNGVLTFTFSATVYGGINVLFLN